MPKGYLVTTYREIRDPDKLKAYAKLALPAITEAGGRFLVRGMPIEVLEAGENTRTVVVEFDSVDAVKALYNGDAYKRALDALDGSAIRDMRIVEGA